MAIFNTPPKFYRSQTFDKYLIVDLFAWMLNIVAGLVNLSFQENFQSFTIQNLSIPAGEQVAISNQFNVTAPGLIPSQRLITRQIGASLVIDGATPWTTKFVYLQNSGTQNVVITVTFFR